MGLRGFFSKVDDKLHQAARGIPNALENVTGLNESTLWKLGGLGAGAYMAAPYLSSMFGGGAGAGAGAGGAASLNTLMGGTDFGGGGGSALASIFGGGGGRSWMPALAGGALGLFGNNYATDKARDQAAAQAAQANAGYTAAAPYISDLYGRTKSWMDEGGTQVPGLDPYHNAAAGSANQAIAGMSGTLTPAMDAVRRAMGPGGSGLPDATAGMLQGGAGRSQGYLGQLDPVLSSMTSGMPNTQTYDPIIQSMRRNAIGNLRENVIPGINDRFIGSGSFGGGRYQKALGIAAGKTNEALINAEANLGAQAASQALDDRRYGAGLYGQLASDQASQAAAGAQLQNQFGNMRTSQSLQAAGMVPGLNQASLMPFNVLNMIGDRNRQIAMDRANAPAQNLGMYSQIMGGSYARPQMGQTPIYSDPIGSALGGAIAGPKLWQMMGGM